MKLVSLNIEGMRHFEAAGDFIKQTNADVICVQECPEAFILVLKAMGYHTTYSPRCFVNQEGAVFVDGIALATKEKHEASIFTYFAQGPELATVTAGKFDEQTGRNGSNQSIIVGTLPYDNDEYTIATTHFTWTPDGSEPCLAQLEDSETLLNFTQTLKPHLMTGDFNIPRHHNRLYEQITKHYTDTIPAEYGSSLDKSKHWRGDDPARAHLFTDYMVDYIFTQPPYQASDVRLEFGISDHAAVVATITKG